MPRTPPRTDRNEGIPCFNWAEGCRNHAALIVQGKCIQGELCQSCFDALERHHPGEYQIVGTVEVHRAQ